MILLKGDRVQGGEGGSSYSMQRVISMQGVYSVHTALGQRAADKRQIMDAAYAEIQSYNLKFLTTIVWHFGKYDYSLFCQELDEKINATVISVH